MSSRCDLCGFMIDYSNNCPNCHAHRENTRYECPECRQIYTDPGVCGTCGHVLKPLVPELV